MKLSGALLAETYQVGELLGSGGMGDVYEAFHTRLNRRLAIKILHPRFARDPETFARFRREAQITGEIGHPHIVEIIDFNTMEDGSPYIVMERLQGEDLATRLARLEKVPVEAVLHVADQLGSALAAAHAKGVVHRDLKPENIFLCSVADDDWYVKILDFGISKIRGSTSVVTQDHTVLGTPNFMSPEQAEGRTDQVDERTDQFALAAILYQMLTGRAAFDGDTVPSILYQVVHTVPPAVHETVSEVSPLIGTTLSRAMAKKPEDRFDQVRTFVRSLRGIPADADTGQVITPEARAEARKAARPVETAETVLGDTGAGEGVDRSGRRRLALAAGIAVMALGLVAALFALGGGEGEGEGVGAGAGSESAAGSASDAGSGLASDPDPEPATAAPITVRFSSRPQADRVLLDGELLEGDSLSMPGDGTVHSVRFEKEGYEPEEMEFVADLSQALRVRLQPRDAPARAKPDERKRRKKRRRKRRSKEQERKKEGGGFILDL